MVSQKMKKVRFRTQLLSSGCTVLESMLRRKSRKACFSNGTELKKKSRGKKFVSVRSIYPVDEECLGVRQDFAFRTILI